MSGTSTALPPLLPAAGGARSQLPAAVLLRLLGALVILAVSISSLIVVEKPASAPHWLARWFVLLPPPSSANAYKTEMILLIIVSSLGGIAFVTRSPLAQMMGPVLGFGVIGIVIGNIADLSAGHQFIEVIFSQKESTATWLCCGLGLIGGLSSLFSSITSTQLVAVIATGTLITGVTAGVTVAAAPNFNDLYGLGDQYSNSDSGGSVDGPGTASGIEPGTSTGIGDESLNAPDACTTGWDDALDVSTSDLIASICVSPNGDAFLVATLQDGQIVNVAAQSSGAGWTGYDGNTRYDVDPDVVAIYDNGNLVSDQAVSGAPPSSGSSGPSQFARLADLVQIAHDGRLGVRQLQRLTLDGHCSSVSNARSVISRVEANRGQLVRAAARLQQSPAESLPIATFERAMQDSLNADRAWHRWISASWSSWVFRGCGGSAPRGANFGGLLTYSRQANRAKNAFVARYDPIAASHGRRSNWLGLDI